jgi:hypothetical protein
MTDNLVEIPIAGEKPTPATPAPPPAAPPLATSATPAVPAVPPPAIPTVEDMEQNLQQSGKLLPHLRVEPEKKGDTSPLASLQPDNMVQTPEGPRPLNLPSQKQQPLVQTELATTHVPGSAADAAERWWTQLQKPAKNLVAAALTARSLYGIYSSIVFILVTYPELNAQLSAHMITQAQVNGFATEAIIIVINTVISMFFALHIIRSKAATWLNTIIGILFLVGSTTLSSYLSSHFDFITPLTTPFYTLTNSLKSFSARINNTEVTWFQ